MKITFKSTELVNALTLTAAHAKESILFECNAEEQCFCVTGTGDFSQFETFVKFSGEEAPESFVLSKDAVNIISSVQYFEENIDFVFEEESETDKVEIKGQKVHTYLPLGSKRPVKFSISKEKGAVAITVNTDVLMQSLARTTFASQAPKADAKFKNTFAVRFEKQNVLADEETGEAKEMPFLKAISSEGHIFAVSNIPILKTNKAFEDKVDNAYYILNSDCLQLSGIKDDKVTLLFSDNMVSIKSDLGTLYALVLKEPAVYGQLFKAADELDTLDFAAQIFKQDALKALSLIPANEGKVVRIRLDGDKVNIVEGGNVLDSGVEITARASDGSCEIFLSRDYMAPIISKICQESITIAGKKGDSFVYFQGEDENSFVKLMVIKKH